jgi:single-strand DNA-binding protein
VYDTAVTIVGNVLTAPEWRRTVGTGTTLVTFKVASTSRRFDKDRESWVNGDSLRVRVSCWRKLGENVSLSVQLGDPVIVHGRLYSRDWTDDQGARHTSYELDAMSIGHDLSRGVGKFARRRPAGPTGMVHDEANAAAIGGELTEAIEDPGRPGDLPPDHELFENFDAAVFAVAEAGPTEAADADSDKPADVEPGPVLAGAAAGRGAGGVTSAGGGSRAASRSRTGGGAGAGA